MEIIEINGAKYACMAFKTLNIDKSIYSFYVLQEGTPKLDTRAINIFIRKFNNFADEFIKPWYTSINDDIDNRLAKKTISEQEAAELIFYVQKKIANVITLVQNQVKKGDIYFDFSKFDPKCASKYKIEDMRAFFEKLAQYCISIENKKNNK